MNQLPKMPDNLIFTVSEQYAGLRLDLFLAAMCPEKSRSRIQSLIKGEHVRVNGVLCSIPKHPVSAGVRVELESVPEILPPQKAEPEQIPLEVLYEDDFMLVINKAPGMVVHPAAGNWTGTLVNALLGRNDGLADDFSGSDPLRPGIVHRLDKDTSGCLTVAKKPGALMRLSAAFADRKTSKTYLAIVRGHFREKRGEICNLIGRHKTDRKKMAVVVSGGREARSAYKVVREGEIDGEKVSLVEVTIFTGRTHQIRVHMSYLGHPLAGDAVYGNGGRRLSAPRQMLHAWKLSVPHPESGEKLSFEAPLPEDFRTYLAKMK